MLMTGLFVATVFVRSQGIESKSNIIMESEGNHKKVLNIGNLTYKTFYISKIFEGDFTTIRYTQ